MANGKKQKAVEPKKTPGAWLDALHAAGKRQAYVDFETLNGVVRAGRITGLRTMTIQVDGVEQELITDIELNDDSRDCTPVTNIKKIAFE